MAETRNGSEALSHGDAAFAAYGADCIAILRYTDGEAVMVAVNRGDAPIELAPKAEDFAALRQCDAALFGKLPKLKVAAKAHTIRKIQATERRTKQ